MGIFAKLKGKRIDEFVAEAAERDIMIIDVREANEFARGHIPGAVNVPLSALGGIAKVAPDKTGTLYVHCLSGGRSSRACVQLKAMGYTNAVNIGGINSYRGPVER
jgi:rhodanese-related sulfurtransferase